MSASKPLRRRRLVGGPAGPSSSFGGGGGGNPNEPEQNDEQAEHDVGSSSLLASPTGPLHRRLNSNENISALTSLMEEGGAPVDVDDVKVHEGRGMSFGATLRRTLTASVHSLSTSVSSYGGAPSTTAATSNSTSNQASFGGFGGDQHHVHAGLTILDSAIERRDWGSVLSIVHSPAGPSLSARTSHAPLFYGGRYGTTLLPLHRACMYDAPPYVVEALVRANPIACRTAESAFHRLPIHLACRSGSAHVDTVRLLLVASQEVGKGGNAFSSSKSCRDKLGRIPLHYLLANGAHPTIVDDLLRAAAAAAHPSASLDMADSEGWLALHVACGSGVDPGIVERLARAHPAAIDVSTRWGSRPLDCARMFVGDRYADRVDEIFFRTLNNPLEEDKYRSAPLGIIYERIMDADEGKWDGVSYPHDPSTGSDRPSSRFAR